MSMQHTAIVHDCKNCNFQSKKCDIFSYICQLPIEAVLMSTHDLVLEQNKKKKVYPCKLQFYYIKVGCKGVFITRTCFHDVDLVHLDFIKYFERSSAYKDCKNFSIFCAISSEPVVGS